MNKISAGLIGLLFVMVTGISASGNEQKTKALFVYDKVDENSKFFVECFRTQLQNAGVQFDEYAVDSSDKKDISAYLHFFVYSRVMAFDMASSVRKWVHGEKGFDGKKLFIFVTAAKWFFEKHKNDLVTHAAQRGGTVVDAVSMATGKMSEERKVEEVRTHLSKFSSGNE